MSSKVEIKARILLVVNEPLYNIKLILPYFVYEQAMPLYIDAKIEPKNITKIQLEIL